MATTAPKSLLDVANDSRKDEKASQSRVADTPAASTHEPLVENAANVPTSKKPSLMDMAKDDAKPAQPSPLMQIAHSTPSAASATAPSLMSVAATSAPKTLLSTVASPPPRKSLAASVAAAASDPNALVAVADNLRHDPSSTFGKSVRLTDVAAKMDKERDVEISSALRQASVAVKAENDIVAQQVLPQLVKDVKQQVDTIKTDSVKAVLTAAAMDVKDSGKTHTKAVLQACAAEVKTKAPPPTESRRPPSPTYSQEDDEFDDDESVKKPKKKAAVDNQSDVEDVADIERTSPSTDKGHREYLLAVFRGNMQKIRSMMDSDADIVHATDQHGWNGLHWAASQGHGDVLKYLLQHGAVPHAAEPVNLWSPLHVAVIRAHVACVKLLMENGAAVSAKQRDVYGDRPVDCAVNLTGRRRTQILQLFDMEGEDT